MPAPQENESIRGSEGPPELTVIEEISERDDMFRGDIDHYFRVGRGAVESIWLAMQAAWKSDIHSILDCPCGHGRVLRTLKSAFPDAELTACDIDRDAVQFCAETFDAVPAYAETRPEEIRFDRKFDLIWSGSLLTHLEAERFVGFLSLFASYLAPDGLLVFTTNGPHTYSMLHRLAEIPREETVAERIDREQAALYFPIPQTEVVPMIEKYRTSGFAYTDYEFMDNFGATLASPAWICKQLEQLPDLRLVTYTHRGWDRVQDVVACIRLED